MTRVAYLAGRDQLTQRELDVVELVVDGLTNAEIAARLFLSEDTVKTHLRRILARLGARNRAHLVAEAFRRDLVR